MVGDTFQIVRFGAVADVRINIPAIAYLFLDDTLLQFLHLLKDVLAQLHSHFARVFYDAI